MFRLSIRLAPGVLALLLALAPGAADAQDLPSEAGIAELLKTWTGAWERTNVLALEPLAAPGHDPFQLLRQKNLLDWPASTRTLLASPTLPVPLDPEGVRLTFFQANESRTALGVFHRASFKVSWSLQGSGAKWSITELSLAAAREEELPLELRAGRDDLRVRRARRALENQRLQEAMELLDAVLALPSDQLQSRSPFGTRSLRSQALWLRGRVEVALERPQQAIPHWLKGLKETPRFPAIDNAIGAWFASRGELQRAMTHWRSSLKASPDQPSLALKLEVHERAFEHYGDPDRRRLFLEAVTGEPELAVFRLTRLLALDPDHPETRRRLALAYLLRRDPDTAHALLEENEYFHPADVETRYLLARTALARDRVDDALHWFEAVWRERPGYRDVITFLSELNASSGRYGEAVRHLLAAIEHTPEDAMLLFKLGVYSEELGEHGAARTWFERAARLGADPDVREALRLRLRKTRD